MRGDGSKQGRTWRKIKGRIGRECANQARYIREKSEEEGGKMGEERVRVGRRREGGGRWSIKIGEKSGLNCEATRGGHGST